MNKKIIITAACSLFLLGTSAKELNDTTIVVENPNRVTVEETKGEVKITAEGAKDNPAYRLERSYELNTGGLTVIRERTSWDISLPVINKIKQKKYKRDYHLQDFYVGFASTVNADPGLSNTFGSSLEIGFTPFEISGPTLAPGLGCMLGVGFAWRNTRLTGSTRFVKTGSQLETATYPEGADIQFSRIKTFSITVPLLLEWQHDFAKNTQLWIQAGPMFNFTTYASMKTRYKLDGEKHKEFDKNIHQTPLTVDIYGAIGINDIGLYCRYAPCHILKTAYNPAFSTISFGVKLAL